MMCVRPVLWVTMLFAALSVVGTSRANADLTVTLEGVTFADGGTASGYFDLNVYGYLVSALITTTPGTSSGPGSLTGYTYTAAGAGVPSGPAPFDSVFYFNSTADNISLILLADAPVTDGGSDPLIVGPGSGGSVTVSNEYCTEGAPACGGTIGYLDGRLITAGTLYAPEPASVALLGVGSVLLPTLRRKRASARREAAFAARCLHAPGGTGAHQG